MNAVGKTIGVTGQTVQRWLDASGVQVRNKRVSYPARVKAEAIALYTRKRLSAAAVAKMLGLKVFTVKEWLSAAGVIRTMSEAAALSVAAGCIRSRAASRSLYRSAKTGDKHFAESSFEFLRMQQLDEDRSVRHWERCSYRISYKSPEGKTRHYIPDFLVTMKDGRTLVEEIKPHTLIDAPINVAKFAAARHFCRRRGYEFRILTEHDLGYCRALAPSSLSEEEKRERHNMKRRQRLARETASKEPCG